MCLLCCFEQLPEHLRFNPSVLKGYRHCPSSIRECTASIFRLHNESANIWTHLVPALVVAWRIASHILLAPPAASGGVDWYRVYLHFSLLIIFTGSIAYHTYMPACRTANQYSNLLLFDLLSAVG
jgi:adiponectin receptor